uniref:Uncharacterized protein n=1 Tax=Anguilla anguilla TaxID=7936 RepID=A0A0E9S807_ANGAN
MKPQLPEFPISMFNLWGHVPCVLYLKKPLSLRVILSLMYFHGFPPQCASEL